MIEEPFIFKIVSQFLDEEDDMQFA